MTLIFMATPYRSGLDSGGDASKITAEAGRGFHLSEEVMVRHGH